MNLNLRFSKLCAVAVVLAARSASAQQSAYMQLTGQKQGQFRGAVTMGDHQDQFQLTSVVPTQTTLPASGTFEVKVMIDGSTGSANLLQALQSSEVLTTGTITFVNTDPRTGLRVTSAQISLINSNVTGLSLNVSDGHPSFAVTILAQRVGLKVDSANALAVAHPGTPMPALTPPSVTVSASAPPTIEAQFKVNGAVVARSAPHSSDNFVEVKTLAWTITKHVGGALNVGPLTFTKNLDSATTALAAAAASGAAANGSSIKLGLTMPGLKAEALVVVLTNATFQKRSGPAIRAKTEGNASGTESYVLTVTHGGIEVMTSTSMAAISTF